MKKLFENKNIFSKDTKKYKKKEKLLIKKNIEQTAKYLEERAIKHNALSNKQLKEMGDEVWKRLKKQIYDD